MRKHESKNHEHYCQKQKWRRASEVTQDNERKGSCSAIDITFDMT